MNITTVTSSASGLLSNTYLVNGPEGIVVIDPPMLLSDARVVRDRLEELDRRLAAFVFTHPHPDHVNGASEIRGDVEVPVFATPDTDQVSRSIDGPKREFWSPIFPNDYPPITTFPTHLVRGGDSVKIASLNFDVYDIGPGECATASLWVTGETAFVGDLVYSRAHGWLYEARTIAWLDQLTRARPLLARKTLYVGHGRPGTESLLDEQADYLHAYQKAIRNLASKDGLLSEEAKQALKAQMTAYWPDAPLDELIIMGADPVATELAQRD